MTAWTSPNTASARTIIEFSGAARGRSRHDVPPADDLGPVHESVPGALFS